MTGKHQKILVGGFLIDDGKVLIVRRSQAEEYFPGHYELPGGKVEFGEHPEKSVQREYMEETNLEVTTGKIFNVFTDISDKGNLHTVDLTYAVFLDGDKEDIRLSKAHDDYKWVSKEELEDYHMSEVMRENIRLGFEEEIARRTRGVE